jgi:hypothetical protein
MQATPEAEAKQEEHGHGGTYTACKTVVFLFLLLINVCCGSARCSVTAFMYLQATTAIV